MDLRWICRNRTRKRGQVVNCHPKLTGKTLSAQEIAAFFKRPYMGGLDRHGILTTGTPAQLDAEVQRVVKSAPRQFILGADCAVPGDLDWNRLRHVISAAHPSEAETNERRIKATTRSAISSR